ncbi:MAG TPA: regulatory protein RecX [Deltaproteobacteria bacterium]|nr:regulatory protein RecX [Deltaproteobacteria bacterium]
MPRTGEGKGPSAVEAALRLLSYRARSRRELEERLAAKGFGRDETEAALSRLEETGYIDDRALARAFVRSRMEGRGWGPLKIAAALAQRGVEAPVIESALGEVRSGEAAAAAAALDKWARIRAVPLPLSREDAVRARRFLRGRGFTAEAVRTALEGAARPGPPDSD